MCICYCVFVIVYLLLQATKSVLDKETPGLVIAMITKSLQVTEMAMLSRFINNMLIFTDTIIVIIIG